MKKFITIISVFVFIAIFGALGVSKADAAVNWNVNVGLYGGMYGQNGYGYGTGLINANFGNTPYYNYNSYGYGYNNYGYSNSYYSYPSYGGYGYSNYYYGGMQTTNHPF